MRITAEGNIGIGTSNPVQKLEVENLGHTSMRIDNAQNLTAISMGAGTISPFIEYSGDLYFTSENYSMTGRAVGDTQLVIQHATGNVGIGTTNPLSGLHINGIGSSGIIRVTRSNKTLVINPNYADHNGYAYFGTYIGEDMELRIGTNEGQYLNIDTNGNVGIWEIEPDSKLEVNGEVHITDTNTGSNAGTDLCIDVNGRICSCGNCA